MDNRQIVRVYDVIGTSSAINVADGKLLFERIDSLIGKNIKVELDFANIDFIITAFLNAAIGQLYKKYTSEQLNEYLKLTNVDEADMIHFREVRDCAKIFFKTPADEKTLEDSISNVLNHD